MICLELWPGRMELYELEVQKKGKHEMEDGQYFVLFGQRLQKNSSSAKEQQSPAPLTARYVYRSCTMGPYDGNSIPTGHYEGAAGYFGWDRACAVV